jgi:hypothetical protein
MANPQIRQRRSPMIGFSPTQAQKLIYVSKNLGLTAIESMQGSTVNLYDTVLLSTNATARQTLSFFGNANNKSLNFSNFQSLTLKTGEAMTIETVTFILLTLSSTTLSADSTTITAMTPISMVTAAQVSLRDALFLGQMKISIANKGVVKEYLGYEQYPDFNPKTNGVSMGAIESTATFDTLVTPPQIHGQNSITLESPPVIPPDQKWSLEYTVPPVGTVTGNLAVMCVVGRFGSIFSAKVNL